MNRQEWEAYCKMFRSNSAGKRISGPDLRTKELDGLLWFNHTFQKDWENCDDPWFEECLKEYTLMGSPLAILPRQVLADIGSAQEFLQQIVEYNLAKGTLTLKTDFTLREVSFPYSVRGFRLGFYPMKIDGRPRKPRLTRKRANGLWWIYTVGSLMEEHSEVFTGSEIYETHLTEMGADMWHTGMNTVRAIACDHECKFPSAPRGS